MTGRLTASELAARPLIRTRTVGDLRVHAIEAGFLWLDGGAMFGVVPKPLWERHIPADERNRIPLATRSLLVETPDDLVLIETGFGNKENEKFTRIYGLDCRPPPDFSGFPDRLQAGVAAAGFSTSDVGVVIDTHLHFDHAGGNTYIDPSGQLHLSFPNARYVVQRGEWEYAHRTNERTRASYLNHNFDPVADAGKFDFIEGEVEVVPGISVLLTPGHTPHHQSVLIRSGGETACFVGDLIPTMSHLPLPWIMGYDVEPLTTLESKRVLLRRAMDQDWLLVSTHDPTIQWGYVREIEGEIRLVEPAPSIGTEVGDSR